MHPTQSRTAGASSVLAAAMLIAVGALAATAQETGTRLVVAPPTDADTTFQIDRTEIDSRGPVDGKAPPRKSSVSSLVRVRGKRSEHADRTTLAITFLRVKGAVSGGQLTEPVTFDRNTKDSPDGRPETALVGKTVEMDVRPDGRVIEVRGVDAESTGSAAVAVATIGDLATLVTPLPAGAVAEGASWPAESHEGRGLLRRSLVSRTRCSAITGGHAVLDLEGRLAPAPEGAPPAFAKSIRLVKGTRQAAYRIALADGLPVVARHETEFSVEAPLTASGVDVRVTTSTIITIRRKDGADGTVQARRLAPRPGDTTPNSRLPAWIGAARTAVRRLLGEPPVESRDGRVDSFPAMGLVYTYDAEGLVRELDASANGEGFGGRILGVQIGDTLADAEKLWGRPTSRDAGPGANDVATFAFDDLTLTLDVTRGAAPDKRMADEILRIRVRRSK